MCPAGNYRFIWPEGLSPLTTSRYNIIFTSFKGIKSSLEHAVLQMTNWFAGDQIRNVASIGGNIMTSSPISDLNQIWLAMKCELEFCHLENGKLVTSCHNIAEGFFTGYRKNIVKPRNWSICCSLSPFYGIFPSAILRSKWSQFITKLKIPLMKPNAFVASYKGSFSYSSNQ